MTREEASYILRKFYADGYKSNNYNALERALKFAVICLENLPHWISVEDEMPKEDGMYIFLQSGIIYTAMYYKSIGLNRDVTHWLPLPQAPKKGGEE